MLFIVFLEGKVLKKNCPLENENYSLKLLIMFVYYFQLFLFLLSETKQTLLDIFLTARVKNLFTEKKKKTKLYFKR